nr:hypothetical protein [Rhodoferax sp.]
MAFLFCAGFFVAGFVSGMLVNHPNEQSVRRLRKILGAAWAVWTVLCAVIAAGLLNMACPPSGCLGFLSYGAMLGVLIGWLGLGLCATLGVYVARNYLRNHP